MFASTIYGRHADTLEIVERRGRKLARCDGSHIKNAHAHDSATCVVDGGRADSEARYTHTYRMTEP